MTTLAVLEPPKTDAQSKILENLVNSGHEHQYKDPKASTYSGLQFLPHTWYTQARKGGLTENDATNLVDNTLKNTVENGMPANWWYSPELQLEVNDQTIGELNDAYNFIFERYLSRKEGLDLFFEREDQCWSNPYSLIAIIERKAQSIGLSPEEAENMTQETLIVLYNSIIFTFDENFFSDNKRDLSPMLYANLFETSKRKTMHYYRHSNAQTRLMHRYGGEQHTSDKTLIDSPPLEITSYKELIILFHEAVDELKHNERAVIQGKLKDKTYEKIAGQLELNSPKVARGIATRARSSLREKLMQKKLSKEDLIGIIF